MTNFKKQIDKVEDLYDKREYEKALKKLKSMRKRWKGNARLDVLFGKLVGQFISSEEDDDRLGHTRFTMKDVRRAFSRAAVTDIDGKLELGLFLDEIEEDNDAAKTVITEAVEDAAFLLAETITALREVSGKPEVMGVCGKIRNEISKIVKEFSPESEKVRNRKKSESTDD